jgi:hypothetical protein
MSITYPLSTPTSIGIAEITLRARNAVAISESPFSFNQQIVRHAGQRWEADVSLPPVRKDLLAPWLSMLIALRGQFGTFLLGDPDFTEPQGTATGGTISGAAGAETVTVSLTGPEASDTLLAGDYIQVGSGSSARLHRVLQDRVGSGSMEIWPALRATYTSASLTLTNPQGVFRLAAPATEWSINSNNAYGISFSAVEVI